MTEDPQQIIDTDLLVGRKRRAVGRAVAGADFLMQRAAEDLAERLATVERRFARAAALFSVTPAARDVAIASGKGRTRPSGSRPTPAFLGGEAGIVAHPRPCAARS